MTSVAVDDLHDCNDYRNDFGDLTGPTPHIRTHRPENVT
jgi:hypothetical protein